MNPTLRSLLVERMQKAGLDPSDAEQAKWKPSKLCYFKGGFDGSKRASSYLMYHDEGDAIRGYFGDFHTGFGRFEPFLIEEPSSGNASDPTKPTRTAAERRAALEATRLAAEQDLQGKRLLARQRADQIYKIGKPAEDGHPYLALKRVRPAGLVVATLDDVVSIINYRPKRDDDRLEGDLLVVPLFNAEGELVNVELIDGEGRKASLAAGQRREAFWNAGSLAGAPPVVGLAEGMATSQTIHELIKLPVLSVGGCHNFGPVLAAMKGALPKAQFVLFPDRGNGEAIAAKAAEEHGAKIVPPPQDIKGTDFNDLMLEKGDQAVIDAIEPILNALDLDPDALPGAAAMLFRPRSAVKRPDMDFVLPGLPAGAPGLVVGYGSASESVLVKQIALALALGDRLPWASESEAPAKAHKVGVIFGDTDNAILQARFFDVLNAFPQYTDDAHLSLMDKNLRIYGMPGEDMRIIEDVRGELFDGPFFRRLEAFCEGKRVVFVDPLVKLLDGDETDARLGRRMMDNLSLIGRRTGCSPVVLHHAVKIGATDRDDWAAARGMAAITGAARFHMILRPFTEAECTEANVAPAQRHSYVYGAVSKVACGVRPAPFALRRGPGGVLFPMEEVQKPSDRNAAVPSSTGGSRSTTKRPVSRTSRR
jgi:hypothetical protein